jgi:hypothetical protein
MPLEEGFLFLGFGDVIISSKDDREYQRGGTKGRPKDEAIDHQ